jgi:hypothetical protein
MARTCAECRRTTAVATRPRLCASCSWAALRSSKPPNSQSAPGLLRRSSVAEEPAHATLTVDDLRTLCDLAALVGEDEATVLRRVVRGVNSSTTAFRAELNRLTDKFLSSIER